MTDLSALEEAALVDELRRLSALESGWYANVGARTGARCCAAMKRAANALETLLAQSRADKARIAELEAKEAHNWNEYLAERSARMAANNREFAAEARAQAAESALAERDQALEVAREALEATRANVRPVMEFLLPLGRDAILLADKVHKADDKARAALSRLSSPGGGGKEEEGSARDLSHTHNAAPAFGLADQQRGGAEQ